MTMRRPPEHLLSQVLDSLTDIFALVLDQEQRIIYANASFLEHFGLNWGHLTGRQCFEVMSPFMEEKGQPVELGAPPAAPSYPRHTLLTRQVGGKKVIYESTSYPLQGKGNGGFNIIILRDVTAKIRLESRVRHLYELEANLVQTSMDGIIVNDLMGNILIFNDGAARILGYQPHEVIGRLKVDQLYPEGLAHEVKSKLYSSDYGLPGALENYETLARHKDGTLFPVWLSARLLYADGHEVGIVGFFRDLRERKRLEEELLHHERLATLGQMVAHVSHEIKNPLMLIGGFAQQLCRLPELQEAAGKRLNLILAETQRLEKFLVDLGSYTRLAPTRKTLGNLAALVQEVAASLEQAFLEQKVEFHLTCGPGLPQAAFDAGQLRQVLLNLCKNALEVMPQGGRLSATIQADASQMTLILEDSGPGIPAEQQARLFTPFFTTKERGSGLGLTICRGIMRQHQGDLVVISEAGRGARCILTLPIH
jgi:PAS domain S-box-containing protein